MIETDERFTLRITNVNGVGATIGQSISKAAIKDDDLRTPFRFTPRVKFVYNTGTDVQVSVENLQSQALLNWTMEFDLPMNIMSIWGAEIISRDGNHDVIRSADSTKYLGANSKIDLGFFTDPAGGQAVLSDVMIRGVAI